MSVEIIGCDDHRSESLIHVHSSKILTIQQGLPRGVSSVGNPRRPLTGFHSGRVAAAHLHDIYREVCNGLTKC